MRKKQFIRRKHNKGYTLTEMLIVVAIVVILAGISIVGIAGFRENLKMSELDDYAKIIYLEAQDQLGIVETEGALGSYQTAVREQFPATGSDKRFLKEIYALNDYVQDYPISNPGITEEEKDQAMICFSWASVSFLPPPPPPPPFLEAWASL